MKKIKSALMTALLLFSLAVQALAGIGVSPVKINPSAPLDLSSTTKGFLPIRMTEIQRNSIASPAAGLMLWCSNCGTAGEIQVYNGTAWTNMVGGAAAAATLVIGQAYQGGKIAYIDSTGLHGLIAATEDQSNAAKWFNGSNTVIGATGTAIGTGLANTDAIIAKQATNYVVNYAAKICRDYRGGGYTDWYLPSKDELNQLFINKSVLGGFDTYFYWSSTEGNNYYALNQSFNIGLQYYNDTRYNKFKVRAVRAF